VLVPVAVPATVEKQPGAPWISDSILNALAGAPTWFILRRLAPAKLINLFMDASRADCQVCE